LNNLDYYLLQDHAARRRTTFIGGAVGAALGILLQGLGFSLLLTALSCFAVAGVIEIREAVTYKRMHSTTRNAEPSSLVRRDWFHAALSATCFLILSLLRLPRAEARSLDRKLKEASDSPANPKSIQLAKRIIGIAEATGVKVDPATLEEVGSKFVNAAKENPQALSVAFACANYKSLTTLIPSLPRESSQLSARGLVDVRIPPGKQIPRVFAYGIVPIDEAAEIRKVNEASPNRGDKYGPAYIVLTGGGFDLDEMYLKNVIIRDSYLLYEGGGVELDNVYSSNCDFDLLNDPDALRFLTLYLAAHQHATFSLPMSARYVAG
jgi:hypothetical protein